MEVKIGISESPRELVFNSDQTPEQVEHLVKAALDKGASEVLTINDDKGRRFLVQTARITYIEIGAVDTRRVGFGPAASSAVVS